jgi:histidinol dehydrogenase
MKQRVSVFQKQLLSNSDVKAFNEGIMIQTVLRPIESVGCYVPGGQAAYPSTVVMTALPAKIAGVPRIVVASPSDSMGKVNRWCWLLRHMRRRRGLQSRRSTSNRRIAYGTDTIKPVRKIMGPGSKYVTMAKVLVSQDVAIDMPAGPSEVLVLADQYADPR